MTTIRVTIQTQLKLEKPMLGGFHYKTHGIKMGKSKK